MDEGSKGKSSMKTIPEEAQILNIIKKKILTVVYILKEMKKIILKN